MYWILLICAIIAYLIHDAVYQKTAYYQVTKNPYLSVLFDKGRYGEYLTYKNLKNYEKDGARFLFNLYIPKRAGETTEIDVLMLSPRGLFVFESKNYSGWIFGDEERKTWYQTLPQGRGRSRKESFYNPIMQNRTHIRHLKTLVGDDTPMHSIITFSERCTLKNVQVRSQDIHVINRYDVARVVSGICGQISDACLTDDQIEALYSRLYAYTQVDGRTKEKHIADIEAKLAPALVAAVDETGKPESDGAKVSEPAEAPAAEQQPLVCPRCGSGLVLRQAKRGTNAGNQFYGCSSYPKCRYIRNLTEIQ